MMSNVRDLWAFALVGTAFLSLSAPAFAEPASHAPDATAPSPNAAGHAQATPSKEVVQEAGDHYGRALSLYSDGDYALAVIEFDRAYALVPDYRVLYNIGQVRIQLNNYAKARHALERYLAEGGEKIPADRRQLVARDLEMLSARTATLDVQTNVAGAQISVDDVQLGLSPLTAPLLLDAGDHRLVVRKLGYSAADSQLTLVGGDASSTRLDLTADVQAPASRIIVEKQFVEKSDLTTWIWATWSATGVFAVSGAVIGGLGLKAANDLDALRSNPDATRGQLDSTTRRARTLLVTGDVLGGAAIVSGGIALFLTLTNRSNSERPITAAKSSGGQVQLAFGSRWLGVKGTF